MVQYILESPQSPHCYKLVLLLFGQMAKGCGDVLTFKHRVRGILGQCKACNWQGPELIRDHHPTPPPTELAAMKLPDFMSAVTVIIW